MVGVSSCINLGYLAACAPLVGLHQLVSIRTVAALVRALGV